MSTSLPADLADMGPVNTRKRTVRRAGTKMINPGIDFFHAPAVEIAAPLLTVDHPCSPAASGYVLVEHVLLPD